MITEHLVSLQSAAEMVDLPSSRLFRLGRYLRYTPTDPCLPPTLLKRAAREADPELRYDLILHWLLDHL